MDALGAVDPALTNESAVPGSEVSSAIRVARVVCIFFMIFVHVSPGAADFAPDEMGVRTFDILRFFLVDSLGRASVALLSVVAGYLAVYSLRRETVRIFLGKKTRSLLIPLLLWSSISVAMVVIADTFSNGYIEESFDGAVTLGRLPTLLVGLGGPPADEPLAFLRDVFICALFTPLLLATLRRDTRWFAALTIALAVAAAVTPMGVRPSIPALYSVGIFVAVTNRVPMPSLRLSVFAAVVFFALGGLLAWRDLASDDGAASGLTWMEVGFNLVRVPAALAFWAVALALGHSWVGRQVSRLEPYIFTAFCIHILVSKVAWTIWQAAFGGYYGRGYPVFFFSMPVFVMLVAVIGARFLNSKTPWIFSLLNGGRGLASSRGKRPVPVGPRILAVEPSTP